MSESHDRQKGIALALLAAGLFGISTPVAKVLLPNVDTILMAGLLYLGSGAGLGAYYLLQSRNEKLRSREASLERRDWPWLAGAIAAGGILGPVLLLWGLATAPASSTSLLLNLEGVFTALLAWFVFKENFDTRVALGMALIVLGGLCLSWTGRPQGGAWGTLSIAGACLAWAIDNNLTRKVSAGNPVQIAMLKGLVAGIVNTTLALALGAKYPGGLVVLAVGIVGLVGYGISLTLFVLALRHIGTARTGAYFSTSPFVGATISVLFLGEAPTAGFVIAAAFMGAGVWLHLTEKHVHEHLHQPLEHEHLHTHDEHHQHLHAAHEAAVEPHSHPHQHSAFRHAHPHYPDIHHRHAH